MLYGYIVWLYRSVGFSGVIGEAASANTRRRCSAMTCGITTTNQPTNQPRYNHDIICGRLPYIGP